MLSSTWAKLANGFLVLGLLCSMVLALDPFMGPAHALGGEALATGAPGSCLPLSEEQVEGFFERWNGALGSGEPSQVAQLYAQGALLLPTLSAELRETPQAIRDYFASFLSRHPSGTVTHRRIQLGCNEAVDAGTYRFELHEPEASVEARYTFVYGPEDGEWRILHHHSSLQPG